MKVTPGGDVSSFSKGIEGRELVNPNYGVFDDEGNFYFSDSGSYFESNGCLYVVRPDGRTDLFHPGPLAFPNGLAIDAGGETLYVVQSTGPDIVRLPLRGAVGSEPELYVRTPGAELLNRPTNVALREGEVFFANLGGWHIGAFSFPITPMPLRYPKL